MSKYNKHRLFHDEDRSHDDSRARGRHTEARFEEMCARKGLRYERASEWHDRVEHWDFRVWLPLQGKEGARARDRARVEVKGAKKLRRGDADVQYALTHLEWRGVPQRDGKENPGWLRGKADLIGFEQEKGRFLMVKRKEAFALLEDIVRADTKVPLISGNKIEPRRAYMRTHQGQPRGDCVYLVETPALENLEGSFYMD